MVRPMPNFWPNTSRVPRHCVEGDGEPRLVAAKWHGSVPEIGREQHQHPHLRPHRVFAAEPRASRDPRLAEGEYALLVSCGAHAVRQLDVAGRGDPAARVRVVGVKPRAVQAYRPAAIEAPAARISPPQRIAPLADMLEILTNGRCERRE